MGKPIPIPHQINPRRIRIAEKPKRVANPDKLILGYREAG